MRRRSGFTLIELLIVLSIIALLVSLVTPRYFASLDRAKETALKTSLSVLREAIDQYAADRGRYPDSLGALVQARYLRQLPDDPVTGKASTWVVVPPPSDALLGGLVADVRSGATGRGQDGRLYVDW